MKPQRAEPARWAGDWFAVALFIGFWTVTLVPLLPAGAANTRLVEAFSTDEAMQVNLLDRALHAHSWAIQFGAYGHLYFNLALAPLKALWPVSEQTIVVAMRAISLAAGAGLLLATFAWARRAYGTLTAWLAMTFVAFNPIVYEWATAVHPDMVQALFLFGALYLTVSAFDHPRTARLAASSAVAGLAFAAKYSGLFVLPLIAGALFGRRSVTAGDGSVARIRVKRIALSLAAFVLLAGGFAIDGPWIVKHLTVDGRIDVRLVISLDALVWLIRASGAFLGLVAVTPWTWRLLQQWKKSETVLWGCGVTLLAFTAAFAVTSPYSLVRLAFIKGLYYEAVETSAHLDIQWLGDWTRDVFVAIGPPISVALVGTILGWLADRRRHVWTSIEMVLFSWIALYILVLIAPVHELAVHYALPLIAPAAILAARVATTLTGTLAGRVPGVARAITATAMVGILGGFQVTSLMSDVQLRQDKLDRDTAPQVEGGDWLSAHVPPGTRIVYDYLSYVPPSFTNVTATWGGTREWLASLDPDIVVVNRTASPFWQGPGNAVSYTPCLDNGACGYLRVFTRNPVDIFQKRKS